MENLIEFKNVGFSYRNNLTRKNERLYDDLSFGIESKTLTTIIGESGSGKTTILNLIAGFLKPQKGTILVNGNVVSDMSDDDACAYRNNTIGFIYQSFNLIPEITALQNVMIPLIIANKSGASKKAADIMKSLGLEKRIDHTPSKLSGGEQQRTAIARAIVNDAEIILADEPTGNLDGENAEGVRRILAELVKKGKTVLVVTHDMSFAEISDKVINVSELK